MYNSKAGFKAMNVNFNGMSKLIFDLVREAKCFDLEIEQFLERKGGNTILIEVDGEEVSASILLNRIYKPVVRIKTSEYLVEDMIELINYSVDYARCRGKGLNDLLRDWENVDSIQFYIRDPCEEPLMTLVDAPNSFDMDLHVGRVMLYQDWRRHGKTVISLPELNNVTTN